MRKKELVELVSRKAHLTKKSTNEALDVFFSEISRLLSKGEKITISGFGTFKVITVRSKTVRIPKTDRMVTIKSHRAPRFTPGKTLRKMVSR